MTDQRNPGFSGNPRGGNGGAVYLTSNKKLKRSSKNVEDSVHPEETFGEPSSKKLCFDKKQQGDDGAAVRNLKFETPKMSGKSKDPVIPKTPVTWTPVPEGNKLPSTWSFRIHRDRKYFRCPNGNEYSSLKAAMEALITSSSSLAQPVPANNLPPEETGNSTPLSKNAVDNQPIKISLTEVEMYFVCQRLIPSLQNGVRVHSCPMCDYGDGNFIRVRHHVTQDHPNWREVLNFPNQFPSTSKPKQRGEEVLLRQTPVSKTLLDDVPDISDDEEFSTPQLQASTKKLPLKNIKTETLAENDENEVVIMDDVDTDSAKDERAKGQLLKIFRKGGKQNRPSGSSMNEKYYRSMLTKMDQLSRIIHDRSFMNEFTEGCSFNDLVSYECDSYFSQLVKAMSDNL